MIHRIQIIYLLIFFALLLESCATVNSMKKKENHPEETRVWYDKPRTKDVRAVVVLLHGLNLKPQRMDDWALMLQEQNALVIRFALHGHSGDFAHMRDVSSDLWRNQFDQVMALAQKESKKYQAPIYFVGFSLGALVCLEWLSHQDAEKVPIEKMVLIAPALSVPWYSRAAISTLSIFGKGFMLPSRSPKSYRANRGTSIAAYQALFALKHSLEKNNYRNANINTLVLIDRHDELVDSKEISRSMSTHRLTRWRLEIVDNRFAYDNYGFRHLMVDQEAIGEQLWSVLRRAVIKHLHLSSVARSD